MMIQACFAREEIAYIIDGEDGRIRKSLSFYLAGKQSAQPEN